MTDIYTQIPTTHISTTLYLLGVSIQPRADRKRWTADEEQFLHALDIRSLWVKLWLQIPPWVLNLNTLKLSLLNPRIRTSTISPLTLDVVQPCVHNSLSVRFPNALWLRTWAVGTILSLSLSVNTVLFKLLKPFCASNSSSVNDNRAYFMSCYKD